MEKSGAPVQLPTEMPRHDPEIGRLEVESILRQTLQVAAELFNRGGSSSREGMMLALDVMRSFLRARGLSGQQIHPLLALRQELDHIWEGKRSQLLQPGINSPDDLPAKSRSNAPGKQCVKLYAAACSEALYKLGRDPNRVAFEKLTRTQADTQIACAMRNWPAFDHQTITGRTVKGWRDGITSNTRQDVRRRQWIEIVTGFTSNEKGRAYLDEVLRKGPPFSSGLPK